MSKESNSNWQNRKRQKGDCLYQAVACLKLSPPAMKLWEAFENVCLDWLIFPVLRKSLKIIKTIIKLFDKTFSQKWEIRIWDKTMNQIPLKLLNCSPLQPYQRWCQNYLATENLVIVEMAFNNGGFDESIWMDWFQFSGRHTFLPICPIQPKVNLLN